MPPSPIPATSATSATSVLSGQPQAVAKRLAKLPDGRVVAAAMPEALVESGVAQAIQQGMEAVATLGPALIEQRQQARLRELIDALVPDVPPTHAWLVQARMTAQARVAVLRDSGPWLTGPQIAQLAGFSESNPSAQPSRWKRSGAIFSVPHRGSDYFPAYALDESQDWRPRPIVAEILRVFNGVKDGWGLAYWFASANGYLAGRRPQDVLQGDPEVVAAAARDELLGHEHG